MRCCRSVPVHFIRVLDPMELLSSSFPEGLRVLVVDDDATCLKIVVKMLQRCKYTVTACDHPDEALSLLREKRADFDIVITDVWMPRMYGFKLLQHISMELDIPVVLMSADSERDTVMKGLTQGACFYLAKPVRVHELMTIWQHVIRKRTCRIAEVEPSGAVEDDEVQSKPPDEAGVGSSVNEGNSINEKKRRIEDESDMKYEELGESHDKGKSVEEYDQDDGLENENGSMPKKPRILWNGELHKKFLSAVNHIGLDRAVPKKILEYMKVPGLTRENIASHLQKYRLYLKKVERARLYPNNGIKPSSRVSTKSIFGPIPNPNYNSSSILGNSRPAIGGLHSYRSLLYPYMPISASSISNFLSRFTNEKKSGDTTDVPPGSSTQSNALSPWNDGISQSELWLENSNQLDFCDTLINNDTDHQDSYQQLLDAIQTGTDLAQYGIGDSSNILSKESDFYCDTNRSNGELEKIFETPQLQEQGVPNFTWDNALDDFYGASSFTELIRSDNILACENNSRAGDESLADVLRGFLADPSLLLRQFSGDGVEEVVSNGKEDEDDVNIAESEIRNNMVGTGAIH